MCEGGINTGQVKMAVAMVDDSLALAQKWLEQLHRLADQGRRSASSAEFAQVSVALGEARQKLEDAVAKLAVADDGVTVERL
ncbi:MAG: hypothetical protein N3B11_01040 [Coriobacteriia bacterium]|nr:hypothetical protein [Coriobacteriia bacterium]